MIEGIEILAQSEIMNMPSWTAWILVLLGFGVVVGILGSLADIDYLLFLGIIGICTGFVGLLVIAITDPREPTGRYEYQVIIDENVSFTELYEKYEVIGQNGKIWTIKDKDTATDLTHHN